MGSPFLCGNSQWKLFSLAPNLQAAYPFVPAAPQGHLHLRCYLESQPGKWGQGKQMAEEALRKGLPCPWAQGGVRGESCLALGPRKGPGSPCPGCRRTGPGSHAHQVVCWTYPGQTGQT